MSARLSPRRQLPAHVVATLERRRSSVTSKRDPRRSAAKRTQRTAAIARSIREAV